MVGLQCLERACGRNIKWDVVLFERAQALTQSGPQLRRCFAQRRYNLILRIRFLFLQRNGSLGLRIDRFQRDQVAAPENTYLGHNRGFDSLSLADFEGHFPRYSIVWITAHRAHRRAGVGFREKTQKRGLGDFDFEGFVQRVVEDGIACLVDEGRQKNDVGLVQPRPGRDAPRGERGNNEDGRDTSRNHKAALVPKFTHWS